MFEGDDSLTRTCPPLGPPEDDTNTVYFLEFWKRCGFNMKIRNCGLRPDTRKLAEFIGTHFVLDDNMDLDGDWLPDLPRNLRNFVSSSPQMIQAFEQGQWHLVRQIAAAANLSRAIDYAGKAPMLSQKYLAYANSISCEDFVNDDMSMLATGDTGATAATVRMMIHQYNSGADFITTKTSGDVRDAGDIPRVVKGTLDVDEYAVVKSLYGTTAEAYDALLAFPFEYGAFVPYEPYAEVLRGLTPS